MAVISPEFLDIDSLPSVALVERKQLPSCAAWYLVLEGETVKLKPGAIQTKPAYAGFLLWFRSAI